MAQDRFENVVVTGRITSTSTKQNERYANKTHTKSAYLRIEDPEDIKKLEGLGLTHYQPDTTPDGITPDAYFQVKFSSNLAYYEGKDTTKHDLSEMAGIDTPNFSTPEDIKINVLKIRSEEYGTNFVRITDLLLPNGYNSLELAQSQNPFA